MNHFTDLIVLYLEKPFELNGSVSLRELNKIPGVGVDFISSCIALSQNSCCSTSLNDDGSSAEVKFNS
jgi:hypothetical protein